MNKEEDIKLIQIWLGKDIDVEITRGNDIEISSFNKEDKEQFEALDKFLRVFKLHDKTVVSICSEKNEGENSNDIK